MDGRFLKLWRLLFRRTAKSSSDVEDASSQEPACSLPLARPRRVGFGLGGRQKTKRADKKSINLKACPKRHGIRIFMLSGASGSGKTKFLESLIKQDIENGLGFGVVDPHGDLTEDIKGYLYAIHKDTRRTAPRACRPY